MMTQPCFQFLNTLPVTRRVYKGRGNNYEGSVFPADFNGGGITTAADIVAVSAAAVATINVAAAAALRGGNDV